MNIKAKFINAALQVKKYSPWICAGGAATASIAGVIFTYLGKEKGDEALDKLPENPTLLDVAKAVGPHYAGAVISELIALGLIFVGTNISWKRINECEKILTNVSKGISENKKAIVAAAGTAGLAAANKKAMEEQVAKADISNTDDGKILVFDADHNYLFRADPTKFAIAMNWAHRRLNYLNEYDDYNGFKGYLRTDELYEKLGVEVPHGDGVVYFGDNDGIICNEEMAEGWGTECVTVTVDENITDDGIQCIAFGMWPPPEYHKGLEYIYFDESKVWDSYPEDRVCLL